VKKGTSSIPLPIFDILICYYVFVDLSRYRSHC